jgi:CubicO group peptidase (beta-lactamase class C family)
MGSSGKWVKDGEFTSQFDRLVSKIMSDCKTPGISLAVINDESVYAKVRQTSFFKRVYAEIAQGYGFSKLPDVPVTNETLFNCGSMSKAFTAASVSMLVDDNDNYPDVQWTAPVSSLIREDFVLSDYKYTEQVTVEDILSHRSGLPK